jgi:Cu(I)/Ag(I) efflux system periplasmic protein CusF
MKRTLSTWLSASALVLAAGVAHAQALVDAEVRKIDKEQAKVTLKHGEIKALDMPPMTMVFTVKDKAALDALKVGDKVRFKATQEGGRYMASEFQVVR